MELEISKWLESIKAVLALIFGSDTAVPTWIGRIVAILAGIYGLSEFIARLAKLWTSEILPLFYNAQQKRLRERRRLFAEHVDWQIWRLNGQEEWGDHRFAELEAEIEAEGRSRSRWFFFKRPGLRRERSLSRALKRSTERLVLLEGEPGAGKSVALRHLATLLVKPARKARSLDSLIPLYINLKGLHRKPGAAIDRVLIEEYVLDILKRANDRTIDLFIDDEFQSGMERGSWIFLFDSFDEIPEVLSSSEADKAVRDYANAIADFLGGFNSCRGIVASREFRGPQRLGWPRFRVLQMSAAVQKKLIQRAGLDVEIERKTYGHLAAATDQELTAMAANPLFLGLLCDYMRTHSEFPENAHAVFEAFIDVRLKRDEAKLAARNLDASDLRAHAEHIAFTMASDAGLGLSPTRGTLRQAIARQRFRVTNDAVLDALEFIKLARSENDAPGDIRTFTFAHRRFQEYFATCVVLRDRTRISTDELLTNARWRETAVVILQTQPAEVVRPMVERAEELIGDIAFQLPVSDGDAEAPPTPFEWPASSLHLLGLLQAGLSRRSAAVTENLRDSIDRIISAASRSGTLDDRRWALDVAGLVRQELLTDLIRSAFSSRSRWLADVAYRQVARLVVVPDDVAKMIREELLGAYRNRRIWRDADTIYAQMSRMAQPKQYLDALRLLKAVVVIDVALLMIVGVLAIAYDVTEPLKPAARPEQDPLQEAVLKALPDFMKSVRLEPVTPAERTTWLLVALAVICATTRWMAGLNRVREFGFIAVDSREIAGVSIAIVFRGLLFMGLASPYITGLAVFALAWPPTAFLAVREGKCQDPRTWPFIPFWVLWDGITSITRGLSSFTLPSKETFIEGVKVILGLASVLGSIAVGGYAAFRFFPRALTFAVFGLFGIGILSGLIAIVRGMLRDLRRVRSHQLYSRSWERAVDLINEADRLGWTQFKLEVLRRARQEGRIVASEENEQWVRDHSLAVERWLWNEERDYAGRPPAMAREAKDNPEVLDELYRIADRIRIQRLG